MKLWLKIVIGIAITALVVFAFTGFNGVNLGFLSGDASASQPSGAQAGPGTPASTVPDVVTLETLKAQCQSIKNDPAYLPNLPGVTADGLGGKPLASADADLAEVQRAVASWGTTDFTLGDPVSRAYMSEADRAYTLGDLSPTKNGNFSRIITDLSNEQKAAEVCDRVANFYAGALKGEYQTIAPGTVFAGLVYSNDYKTLGYVCDLVSPPQGVRVLSWTRPINSEFQGDQAKTLPTVKVAIGYRMIVVDKCPVSDAEAAKFGGSLLDKPAPQPTMSTSQPAGSDNKDNNQNTNTGNGAGSSATPSPSGTAGTGTGGTGGNDSGTCGASCGSGGGGTAGPTTGPGPSGPGTGGGGGTSPSPSPSGSGGGGCTNCGGGSTPTPTPTPTKTTTPKPSPTPTPTRTPTPTPTPTPTKTPTPTPTPTPSDSCTGYPVPQECKASPPPWNG